MIFLHAFLARVEWYDEVLRHLASHGFVVVLPQSYQPSLAALLGEPTAAEEATLVAGVLDWLPSNLSATIGIDARTDRPGLAGHSRGGKAAWLVLSVDATRALSVAGVDPVDGTGGPLGGQERALRDGSAFRMPSLVIGTGLGGACAPAGDNHEQFFGASTGPGWHVVATRYGHGDMLDEDAARSASWICSSGDDPAVMRRLTAGLLSAFFRGTLQGDSSSFGSLTDPTGMGTTVEIAVKEP